MLSKAVESGDSRQIAAVTPMLVEDKVSLSRPDGNNVSLQKELGEMTENGLLYQFATRAISKKFDDIKKAINGK